MQVLRAMTKKGRQNFEKKVHPCSFCAPNVKSWLRAWLCDLIDFLALYVCKIFQN